ncbi:antibiotic biosynthesis monooxygenase [Streptomyces sp. NPDC050485]|uniref:antibiotic biosynthesis monooxygenase n=1 Tax=Streptomyces sp. NPDC050485 TaxID=3365617 RepID=UPI00378DC664
MTATSTRVQFNSLPDPARSASGVVKISTWRVGTPELQQAAVEAIARAWGARDWPAAGLLSYSVHTGTDGSSLLHYSQWTDERVYQDFLLRGSRDERVAEIDAAVPGIVREGLTSYELHRSGMRTEGERRVPGCVVVVDVEFEGPDPERQRAWVDTVFEALDSDPTPPQGGIAAHFHTSVDGTRVLNYALWESERAHIDALAAPGAGIGSPTPQWNRVRTYEGLKTSRLARYVPALSLTPADR